MDLGAMADRGGGGSGAQPRGDLRNVAPRKETMQT